MDNTDTEETDWTLLFVHLFAWLDRVKRGALIARPFDFVIFHLS